MENIMIMNPTVNVDSNFINIYDNADAIKYSSLPKVTQNTM